MKRAGLLLLLLLCAPAAQASCGGLSLREGWVREAPPGAGMLAAYGTFKNTGRQARRITAIASPDFEGVEIHETRLVDGRMQMRAVEPLVLAPGAELVLKPGGAHLMLMQPARELRRGDKVAFSFHCGAGAALQAVLPVRTSP